MFSPSKIAVLESKLGMYEELSREMLSKLENAVDKISEGNQRIAIVLERHENRLDESDKADQAILQLVTRVEHNLDELEKKVDQLSRFRWVTIGVCTAAIIILKSAELFGSILTLPQKSLTTDQKTGIVFERVVPM
jgi:transcription termination factor NusB